MMIIIERMREKSKLSRVWINLNIYIDISEKTNPNSGSKQKYKIQKIKKTNQILKKID